MKAPRPLARIFEANGFTYNRLYRKPLPNLPVWLGAYYEKVPGRDRVMVRMHAFYPFLDEEDFYFSVSPGYLCYLGKDGFLRNSGECDADGVWFQDPQSLAGVLEACLPRLCQELVNPDLMIGVLDYFLGGPEVPTGFEYLRDCQITRGRCTGFMREKVAYLMLAGRFDEAASILENDPLFFHPNAKGDYYQKLLWEAKNREISLNFRLPPKPKGRRGAVSR